MTSRASVDTKTGRDAVDTIVWMLILSLACVTVGLLAWASSRGFDLTDEGYYLNAMTHPNDEVGTLLWFGYLYHDLFHTLGWDLVALRRVMLLLTAALGAVMAWAVLGQPSIMGPHRPLWPTRAATSLCIGVCALAVYAQVPLTPGYNTLALEGLMIVVTGLAAAMSTSARVSLVGWCMVGLGIFLSGAGKPSTGLLTLPMLVAFVAVTRPRRWLTGPGVALLIAALCGACLMARWHLTPRAAADRALTGLRLARELGGHSSLVRWDPFHLPRGVGVVGAVLLAATLVGGVLLKRGRLGGRRAGAVALVVAVLAAGAAAWRLGSRELENRVTYALTIVTVVALVSVALQILWGDTFRRGVRARPLTVLAWLGLLVVLPLVYAFGTNTNLWNAMARALVFWALAGVVAGSRRATADVASPSTQLPHLVIVTAVMAGLSVVNVVAPYRGAPLVTATAAVEIGPGRHPVSMPPATAATLRAAIGQARGAGPQEPDKIVDLTGANPGLVWALGARAVGQAWIIGGYPGSDLAAKDALALVGCRALVDASVLWSPSAPRALDGLDLSLVPGGSQVPEDYRTVAVALLPRTGWLGTSPDIGPVAVLQPLRPKSCSS